MALSSSRLSAAIKSALLSGDDNALDNASMQTMCDATSRMSNNAAGGHLCGRGRRGD